MRSDEAEPYEDAGEIHDEAERIPLLGLYASVTYVQSLYNGSWQLKKVRVCGRGYVSCI